MDPLVDLFTYPMVLLKDAIEAKKYDVRVKAKNLDRGVIIQDDLDKHLSKIPDDGANAEWVNLETLISDEGKPNGLQS